MGNVGRMLIKLKLLFSIPTRAVCVFERNSSFLKSLLTCGTENRFQTLPMLRKTGTGTSTKRLVLKKNIEKPRLLRNSEPDSVPRPCRDPLSYRHRSKYADIIPHLTSMGSKEFGGKMNVKFHFELLWLAIRRTRQSEENNQQ